MALMTGLSALTGALSNSPANKTSTTSGTQSQSGVTSNSRNLTPYQTSLQGPLFDYVRKLMTDPGATIQPFQAAARNNVNSTYKGLGDSLRQQFLSTGGGASGKFGTALVGANVDRLGKLADTDAEFAKTATTLPVQGATIAQNLLGMNFGSTTSTSGTESSNGTQVGAGSPMAGAFQGGTSALQQALMMALLGGG